MEAVRIMREAVCIHFDSRRMFSLRVQQIFALILS